MISNKKDQSQVNAGVRFSDGKWKNNIKPRNNIDSEHMISILLCFVSKSLIINECKLQK